MLKNKLNRFWPIVLATVFLFLGILTLKDYGINWDEPVHFMRGQSYLRFFMTGQRSYEGLPKLKFHYPKFDSYFIKDKIDYQDDRIFRRSLYQNDYWNGDWFFKNDSPHPPLSDILAALTNYIFYQKLDLLGDIESYHLFEIIGSVLLVLLVVLFAKESYGNFAGLVAGISLSFYPLFLGESHFNIKDPIEACFIGLTIYAFWKAIKSQSSKWMIGSAIFCGMGLGTKFNIIFVPLIILPWLAVSRFRKTFSKKLLIPLFFYPFLTLAIFFLSWPYLWQNPIKGITETIQYYKGIGLGNNFQPPSFYFHKFNIYPLQTVIFSTPLIILFLAIIGIVSTFFLFRKEKNKTSFLWLLWFLIPIIRVSFPGTSIYGGVRQIMEYIPALALLSGLGAEQLRKLKIKNWVLFPVILVSFLPIALKMGRLHPSESLYFNPLIGGLRGAAEKNFPDWGLSLGNEYRQGIDWFNKNALPEANLTLARGLLSNIPRIWIRRDINFGDYYYSGEAKKGEYIMELIYQGWEKWIPEKAVYLKTLKPVYELKVEGVTVLAIWKNEQGMVK